MTSAVAASSTKHSLFPSNSSPVLLSRHRQHTATQPLVLPPRNHYVNVRPLPPHQPHQPHQPHTANTSSREASVSDSETSTGSISGLSESSEIRLLFANLHNTTAAASTENDRHYNQLKVREGSRVGERTRRILHRPSHLESDTSSSSLAESIEAELG